MKTSLQIKFIGILCIVFGTIGLIEGFIGVWYIEFGEIPVDPAKIIPDSNFWKVILVYVGVMVNTLYLMAGIFFLVKKPFSLKLIYFALTISLLYEIVSLEILKSQDPVFYYNLAFQLVGPLIDLLLLTGVYNLRKRYYTSTEELKALPDKKKVLTPKRLKILSVFGFISFAIPFSAYILWVYAASQGATHLEKRAIYNSYFPDFLQEPFTITYYSIVFCLLACLFSTVGLELSGKLWKAMNVVVLTLSVLLLFLLVFSLM